MISLIEVTCPHCGAQGRVILPPMGSIVMGPCPECKEMLAVFCGEALPLDSAIMRDGSKAEKHDHLLEVLGVFVHERVQRLLTAESSTEEKLLTSMREELAAETGAGPSDVKEEFPLDAPSEKIPTTPISEEEFESFINVELKLLDNKDYFKAIFR